MPGLPASMKEQNRLVGRVTVRIGRQRDSSIELEAG
jgi:hypothetical protein